MISNYYEVQKQEKKNERNISQIGKIIDSAEPKKAKAISHIYCSSNINENSKKQ